MPEFNGIPIRITEEEYFSYDNKTREKMQWKLLEGIAERVDALPCNEELRKRREFEIEIRGKVKTVEGRVDGIQRKAGVRGGVGAGIGFGIVVAIKAGWHYVFGGP